MYISDKQGEYIMETEVLFQKKYTVLKNKLSIYLKHLQDLHENKNFKIA